MNVSVSALSAFLMTTFVCGKYTWGEGGVTWQKHTHTNIKHTHNATPVYHGGSVRQGIHSPSCRSVATDKGDVLRPLLIQHSGTGLQILYLLSPHNSSGLGATNTHLDTHTQQGAHKHTHRNKTSRWNTVHRQAHTNSANLYTYSHC